ncbi:MAG: L-2-hydroxyglutarate oxidase [Acidobacteriota bacterium]
MSLDLKTFDIAIIGGGIVGVATAMELSKKIDGSIILIEKEKELAVHQTGNNSGVIHSGLYYKPGSMKAENCKKGRDLLYSFCEEENIPHERCGKIVVATRDEQIPDLDKLEEKGKENGLKGLKRLKPEEIKEYEPHVDGVSGLFVQETGIVNFKTVTEKFGEKFKQNGGVIKLNSEVKKITGTNNEIIIHTTSGDISCLHLANCAGLQSDRIAKMAGVDPELKIIPFRGEYYELKEEYKGFVKNLIYPVPDPRFPFLGVHFTRMIEGGVEAGPNAVTAFKREGYRKLSFSIKDVMDYTFYGGFWKMAAKYWKTATPEYFRSLYKPAFVKALKELIPEIEGKHLKQGGAGVRAQALEPDGFLVDDFRIKKAKNMIHVLNAPSPAATAAISIAVTIADSCMNCINKID